MLGDKLATDGKRLAVAGDRLLGMSQRALEGPDLVERLGQLGALLGGRVGHGAAQLQRLLVRPQGGLARSDQVHQPRHPGQRGRSLAGELGVIAVPRQEITVLFPKDIEQFLELLRLLSEPALPELGDLIDHDPGLVVSLLRVGQRPLEDCHARQRQDGDQTDDGQRRGGRMPPGPLSRASNGPTRRTLIGTPSRKRRRSWASSNAEGYRRAGSFSRHFRQIVSRSRAQAGLSAGGYRLLASDLLHDFQRVVALEGRSAGQRLVQGCAQAVDVTGQPGV